MTGPLGQVQCKPVGPVSDCFPLAAASSTVVSGIPGVVITSLTAAQTVTASTVYYMPMGVNKPITVTGVRSQISNTSTAGAKVRFSIYNAGGNAQPTSLVYDLGEITVAGGAGIKTLTTANSYLPTGNYLLRMHTDASAAQAAFNTVRGNPASGGLFDFVTNWQLVQLLTKGSVTYAVAENPGTAWTTLTTTTSPMMYHAILLWTPS